MISRARPLIALVAVGAALLATRGAVPPGSVALERASIELVDAAGWALVDVRILVAPQDAVAVEGATALVRDHWVFEIELVAPDLRPRVARLSWNDEARGEVEARPDSAARAVVRYDVGDRLEPVSIYRLTLVNM